MIFFGADWHFNDTNILKYQQDRKQKFGNTIKANNTSLINRQNSQVSDDDTVYMVGDFIYGKSIDFVINIVNRLNGTIYLMLGNHDVLFFEVKNKIIIRDKFFVIDYIKRVDIYNGYEVQLFHYPLYEQPNYTHKKSWHLHGHLHGIRNTPDLKSIDISMNLHDYKLLSEHDVYNIIKNKLHN